MPVTSTIPANPAIPPLNDMTTMVIKPTFMPAYLAALGFSPVIRILYPNLVYSKRN